MPTDEDYLRRYLDDPVVVDTTPVPQQNDITVPPTPDETYLRRYLDDPTP